MGENRLPDCRQVDVADMSDRAADQNQTRVEEVDDSRDRVADELSGRSHQISYDWVAVCQSILDIGANVTGRPRPTTASRKVLLPSSPAAFP